MRCAYVIVLLAACASDGSMEPYFLEGRISNPPPTIEFMVDGVVATEFSRTYRSFASATQNPKVTLTGRRADLVDTYEIGAGDCHGFLGSMQELAEVLVAEEFTIYLVNSPDQIFERSPDFVCTDINGRTEITIR